MIVPSDRRRPIVFNAMAFDLRAEFPELANELAALLSRKGEDALAAQVQACVIVDRCRCGDDFCAMMYVMPRPSGPWPKPHRNVVLDPENGMLILDVVHAHVAAIEILYRDDIRDTLLRLLP